MDVLNNAKNCTMDSYRTTKWLFDEILELKHRLSTLERDTYNLKNWVNEDELSVDKKMDAFNTRSLEMDKALPTKISTFSRKVRVSKGSSTLGKIKISARNRNRTSS